MRIPWEMEPDPAKRPPDPRLQHRAMYAELEERAKRMVLPLPPFALEVFGAAAATRGGGNATTDRDWDQDSVASWAQSPRQPESADEAHSAAPATGVGPASLTC